MTALGSPVRRCSSAHRPSAVSSRTAASRKWQFCGTTIRSKNAQQYRTAPLGNRLGRTRPLSKVSIEESDRVTSKDDEYLLPFVQASSPSQKLKILIEKGKSLTGLPPAEQTIDNRVMGCTTRTYLSVEKSLNGGITFLATSDSDITRGWIVLLQEMLSGSPVDDILQFDPKSFASVLDLPIMVTPSRANGFFNLVETLKRKTRTLPQGAFAEAQAKFLEPDNEAAAELGRLLKKKRVGVVAHFYMDAEVQGMLAAASHTWPHIHISDSLLMADTAVKMAEDGCRHIAVLGVDFMSENVRAILDKAGHTDTQVIRMSSDQIGCSLADAAGSPAYFEYLQHASQSVDPLLHVIYINTSLLTKAKSHRIIPTITCTSSNVVQTTLQAFAQVENLRVIYGPDTYMGTNIKEMFQILSDLPDDEIRQLHPRHNRQTIRAMLDRFDYFKEGICIVHHLFGGEVCSVIREAYGDAYITAHFEVPGEMFGLAMEAKKRGMGVVGSTSNILEFISTVVGDLMTSRTTDRLQFVLGTESGMITSIVNRVRSILRQHEAANGLEVEIIFPVSPNAITTTQQSSENPITLPDSFDVVPGPSAGEGCSAGGGCANCPYMKVNTLDALRHVLSQIPDDGSINEHLQMFHPLPYTEKIEGPRGDESSVQDLGSIPVLHMRHFQQNGVLSQRLVQSIQNRDHS